MSSAVQGLLGFQWNLLLAAKNRLGLTRTEAKKIFYSFRRGKSPDPETGGEPSNGGEMRVVLQHMKDTSARLDRIEEDLDYLRRQVDRILEKL